MYKWDLTKIYSKREDFYLDMTIVRDEIKKLNEYREFKIDAKSLYDLIEKCFEIREKNNKSLVYASLNYYLDMSDDVNIKMKEQAENLDHFVNEETSFIEEIINLIADDKLREFYQENKELKKYRYYIENVKRMGKHFNDVNFKIIDNSNLNISKSLIKYNDLIKNMDFGSINGVVLNSDNIGKYLINGDRSIRKKVFSDINKSYSNLEKDYFSIIKSIVDNRRIIVEEEKYSSVLDSELSKDDLLDKIIDNLIKGVNKNIPLLNKYLKLKCNFLGISNPSLYDINLPFITLECDYDLKRAIEILENVFTIYGSDYVDTMHNLLKEKHLDLEISAKKHPTIVFSWNNYSFMNYRNRYVDIKNLAHEFGHIINYTYSMKKQPFVYRDSTVFVGEAIAIVNEILLNDYLYNNSSNKEEQLFYLVKNIENFISQVFRQTLYTEFENLLYNSNQLNLDLLNESYLNLIKKYYGKVISVTEDIKVEWMRVGHLFRCSYEAYKYAFSYIIAFNIVKKLKEDDNFKYVDFLESGCCCSNEKLLKHLGIDIYDEEMLKNSFTLLEDYIEKVKNIMEDLDGTSK